MVSLYCTQKYANKYGIPKTPEDLSKHLVTGNLLFDNTVPTNFELKKEIQYVKLKKNNQNKNKISESVVI